MKKMLIIVLLASLAFVLNGCVSVAANTEVKEMKVYHTPVMSDIDIAANMSPEAKVTAYKAIAGRPGLLKAERAYLSEAVRKDSHLAPKDRDDILITLIKNPKVEPD
jgi:Flp pilus assembly protein TadD